MILNQTYDKWANSKDIKTPEQCQGHCASIINSEQINVNWIYIHQKSFRIVDLLNNDTTNAPAEDASIC